MNTAYLLLGGNLGDRLQTLQACVALLSEQVGPIIQASPVYETASWGKEDLPAHLNQAIKIATTLSAPDLLAAVLDIEQQLGRQRQERWGCRTIDIDIIFYNDAIIDSPALTIPHPLMQLRRFVLQPLSDIAAHYKHPILKKTVSALLSECRDSLAVVPFVES